MTFRKDINGLRALAVVAVVLFHFQAMGFSGGFVGVDIFFVISGYLMTAIIFTKLRNNKFSIIDFYLHRARRIIPALAVLCMALILFGYFNLLPKEYSKLLKNTDKAILFISNISFYKHSGYFDTPSAENWLLHTWSLSVEWQFYILYPIIISVCYKFFNEKIVKILLLLIGALSLIASIILTPINQSAAFYLLPTRAWEMVAGGIIFLYPLPHLKFRFPLSILGLLLVFASIFTFDSGYLWPSYFALLPVTATMLIIWCNRSNIIIDNAVMQWLGKISYSLYLWHWPVSVLSYLSGVPNSIYVLCLKLILSLILATLSYLVIERKRGNISSQLKGVIKYVGIILFVLACDNITVIALKKYAGIRERMFAASINNFNILEKYTCHNAQNDEVAYCKSGADSDPVAAIVLGDSHALVIANILENVVDGSVLAFSIAGCPTLNEYTLKDKKLSDNCNSQVYPILDKLKSEYTGVPVIIANYNRVYLNPEMVPNISISKFGDVSYKDQSAYMQKYKEIFTDTMCQLSKNRTVFIMKPFPDMISNVPATLLLRKNLPISFTDITLPLDDYKQNNKIVLEAMDEAKKACGITLLDPVPYLCSDGKYCIGSKDEKALYMDNNHLNAYGKTFIFDLIKSHLPMEYKNNIKN